MTYFLHRTALRPLLPNADEADLIESCKLINQISETKFLNFLHQQGLAPMWHKTLHRTANTTLVSETFFKALHQSRLLATGKYMLQSQGLKQIKSTLDNENIDHVVS
jgi:hypothetical protein